MLYTHLVNPNGNFSSWLWKGKWVCTDERKRKVLFVHNIVQSAGNLTMCTASGQPVSTTKKWAFRQKSELGLVAKQGWECFGDFSVMRNEWQDDEWWVMSDELTITHQPNKTPRFGKENRSLLEFSYQWFNACEKGTKWWNREKYIERKLLEALLHAHGAHPSCGRRNIVPEYPMNFQDKKWKSQRERVAWVYFMTYWYMK